MRRQLLTLAAVAALGALALLDPGGPDPAERDARVHGRTVEAEAGQGDAATETADAADDAGAEVPDASSDGEG